MTKPPCQIVPANADHYGFRNGDPISMLVIHTIQGSLKGAGEWFSNPEAPHVSSHYGIGFTGMLVQFVDDEYAAYHAGNMNVNRRSIGIELEGDCTKPDNFTPEMMAKLSDLSAYLVEEYAIPVDRLHIVGHCEVPNPNNLAEFGGIGRHSDPGRFFPWKDYLLSLTEILARSPPNV